MSHKKTVVPVVAGSVLMVIALLIVYFATSQSPAITSVPSKTVGSGQSDEASTTSSVVSVSYKDGTYTATGSYMAPSGQESIGVTLTLQDNIITTVSVDTGSSNEVAQQYQDMFAANYKTLVVGKAISDVQLSRVSGASLTPRGFNDALAQIATEAQA